MQPQDALGAFTEALDHRCQSLKEKEQVKLIEAMNWEDKTLQQFIQKNRLSEWLRTAFETAQDELAVIAGESVDAQPETSLVDTAGIEPMSVFGGALNAPGAFGEP